MGSDGAAKRRRKKEEEEAFSALREKEERQLFNIFSLSPHPPSEKKPFSCFTLACVIIEEEQMQLKCAYIGVTVSHQSGEKKEKCLSWKIVFINEAAAAAAPFMTLFPVLQTSLYSLLPFCIRTATDWELKKREDRGRGSCTCNTKVSVNKAFALPKYALVYTKEPAKAAAGFGRA